MEKHLRTAGLVLVMAFFLIGGVAHFAYSAAETSIIPAYVPYPEAVNYLVGACEILGAVGLMIPAYRRAAGIGLMLLTIAVTPANVFMLQHAERYPDIPVWLLVARLPAQLLLLVLIGWCSRVIRPAAAKARRRA